MVLSLDGHGSIWGKVVCCCSWCRRSQSRLAIRFVGLAASCLEATEGSGTAPAKFPNFSNHAADCLEGERCPSCRSRGDWHSQVTCSEPEQVEGGCVGFIM